MSEVHFHETPELKPHLLAKLISVISLLSAETPSVESPANVDAAKEVREDIAGYRKKVRRLARKSAEEAYD